MGVQALEVGVQALRWEFRLGGGSSALEVGVRALEVGVQVLEVEGCQGSETTHEREKRENTANESVDTSNLILLISFLKLLLSMENLSKSIILI